MDRDGFTCADRVSSVAAGREVLQTARSVLRETGGGEAVLCSRGTRLPRAPSFFEMNSQAALAVPIGRQMQALLLLLAGNLIISGTLTIVNSLFATCNRDYFAEASRRGRRRAPGWFGGDDDPLPCQRNSCYNCSGRITCADRAGGASHGPRDVTAPSAFSVVGNAALRREIKPARGATDRLGRQARRTVGRGSGGPAGPQEGPGSLVNPASR
jgi:hypothetical protein